MKYGAEKKATGHELSKSELDALKSLPKTFRCQGSIKLYLGRESLWGSRTGMELGEAEVLLTGEPSVNQPSCDAKEHKIC